jgi:hypothetical protein
MMRNPIPYHICYNFRQLLMALLLSIGADDMRSQPGIQFSYSYLQSPEWDKIIQTYNSSRPWQKNQLVPLTHVLGTALSWNWRIQQSREIHILPELGYHYTRSQVTNFEQEIRAGFHQANIGFTMRTHPKCLIKPVQNAGPLGTRWYIGLGAGFALWMPYQRTNGELYINNNGDPYREFTGSIYLHGTTGLHAMMIGSFVLTPEVSVKLYPDAELTDFAEAVNGHNLTGMRNATSNIWMFSGALRITYVKKKSNWWDKPRQGDKT